MKVLVVGAGEVGFHLAHRLSEESQDVVLIEADPERTEFASQHLDVLTVVGNGASIPVLERAGVKGARMLLAVTSKDEVNLIACLAAKRMDVRGILLFGDTENIICLFICRVRRSVTIVFEEIPTRPRKSR